MYAEFVRDWQAQVIAASGDGHTAEMARRSQNELKAGIQEVIDALQIVAPEKYGSPAATEELLSFANPC